MKALKPKPKITIGDIFRHFTIAAFLLCVVFYGFGSFHENGRIGGSARGTHGGQVPILLFIMALFSAAFWYAFYHSVSGYIRQKREDHE